MLRYTHTPSSCFVFFKFLPLLLKYIFSFVVLPSVYPTGDLYAHVAAAHPTVVQGAVRYTSDGFSVYLALTQAGLDNLLPISEGLVRRHPCFGTLQVKADLTVHNFADNLDAFRWGIDNLQHRCNPDIVFNANYFHNAVQG